MAENKPSNSIVSTLEEATAPQPSQQFTDRASTRRSTPSIATVGRVVTSFQRKGKNTSSLWKDKHGIGLKWFKKWDHQCFKDGRVLLIDYISHETAQPPASKASTHPHLAVGAQEFNSLEELKQFYFEPNHLTQAALRVIHVQNAPWANPFLLKQFNIDNDSDLVGMSGFARWAKYERPRLRNGKPYPSGRSWPVQTDPWRNVSRTAIGVDYIRSRESTTRAQTTLRYPDTQVLHLDSPEENGVAYGHEVGLARFAVYVQRNLGPVNEVSPSDTYKVPYVRSGAMNGVKHDARWKDKQIEFDKLDNSNTIIIFEDTTSNHLSDSLIDARSELEGKWRRLSFYLKKEQALNDARLSAQCANIILSDVFHALGGVWEDLLSHASEHVALLEDRIYEDPTDESKAPSLWTNQAAWLKVDKVMFLHRDILAELQGHLQEMSGSDSQETDWLGTNSRELERIAHGIQEDLVQPTNNLIDLMYKSVGIRDSRQSLQLGLSMWRLSWITFIFLPLTFIVGFFSMEVNIFTEQTVDVGWYFLGAGLTMIVVLFLWYKIKSSLQTKRETTYQRGVYEQLYDEMSQEYPHLWTSRGAAKNIQPTGFWAKIKWNLLQRWFDPKRTINKTIDDWDDEDAGLGYWSRMKRSFLRSWLSQLNKNKEHDIEAVHLTSPRTSIAETRVDEAGVAVELAQLTTPVLIADAEPNAAVRRIDLSALRPLNLRGRRGSSGSPRRSEDRSSSRASAELMVERRDISELESEEIDIKLQNGAAATL